MLSASHLISKGLSITGYVLQMFWTFSFQMVSLLKGAKKCRVTKKAKMHFHPAQQQYKLIAEIEVPFINGLEEPKRLKSQFTKQNRGTLSGY